jgi:hypothetical protein
MIGLREVERNLQGLTMGIPPLRRGEVPLHLQRHTMGVPENVNSLLRHVVHAMICYLQHNVVQGDYILSGDRFLYALLGDVVWV